ncbi:MAG TPA: LysM peptidoglycan-binding domain-containing protein [Bryocella sp.]|nr:LysM peptidoglycan-binding domain-containing protein [Bryocella sp.]
MGSLAQLGGQIAGAVTGNKPPVLALLSIQREKQSSDGKDPLGNLEDPITCQFNPINLTIGQTAAWTSVNPSPTTPAGALHFNNNSFQTLTFDLYFDTTEANPAEQQNSKCKAPGDVRECTKEIAALVRMVGHLHRPPVCAISWGAASAHGGNLFNGMATSITQHFTYFDETGSPLRAWLGCSFLGFLQSAWAPPEEQFKSNDLTKAYIVRRGDTLASIASDQMHDSALWRAIASANRITDPLELQPGRVLQIPTTERW